MNLTVIGLEILRSFDFENHSFVGEFFFLRYFLLSIVFWWGFCECGRVFRWFMLRSEVSKQDKRIRPH